MLGRKKKQEPVRRQRRLRADDVQPPTQTFMYHARRDQRPEGAARGAEDEALARRRGSKSSKLLPVVMLLLLPLAAYMLTLTGSVHVEMLTSGNPALSKSAAVYQQSANNSFRSSVLNRFKPAVNTRGIEREMLQEYPELANAIVTVPFFGRTAQVYVEPARPVLLLAAANGTYVLDTRGIAVAIQADAAAGNQLRLPTVTDQSNIRVELGKQALTPSDLRFISTVLSQLKAKKIAHTTLTLPPASQQFDVAISGQPYYVKFNLASETARQQVGTFIATQAELKRKNITPAKYIDVRVEGRAYYQ